MKRALAGLVRENAAPQRQARALGLAELAAVRAHRVEGKGPAAGAGRQRAVRGALLWGLRRSEAAGSVRYLPREALRALAAIRPEGAGPGDPVFGLSGRQVGRRVAAAARAAGLGEGFSGHSGRVGLAAELSRAGASTHEIAAAGGWQSAGMVIRYTRRETAKRGAVARYLEERQDLPG